VGAPQRSRDIARGIHQEFVLRELLLSPPAPLAIAVAVVAQPSEEELALFSLGIFCVAFGSKLGLPEL
jgi:hypothetical protein